MNKYKLSNEIYTCYDGTILHRIECCEDFTLLNGKQIKKGDKGGWIENENNLSQTGNCWVYGNALVYENAQVCDNALVYMVATIKGNSRIYGNAQVYDGSTVTDSAQIFGNAKVYGSVFVYNTSHIFDNAKVFGKTNIIKNTQIYGDSIIGRKDKNHIVVGYDNDEYNKFFNTIIMGNCYNICTCQDKYGFIIDD